MEREGDLNYLNAAVGGRDHDVRHSGVAIERPAYPYRECSGVHITGGDVECVDAGRENGVRPVMHNDSRAECLTPSKGIANGYIDPGPVDDDSRKIRVEARSRRGVMIAGGEDGGTA